MDNLDLFEAAVLDDAHAIRQVLASGVNVDVSGSSDGSTALMVACSAGRCNSVRELLVQGASTSKFNFRGETALSYAIVNNNFICAQLLLEHGADPNLPDSDALGMTPIMYAVYHGNSSIFDLLTQYGADINKLDSLGWSCLMRAVTPNCPLDLFIKVIESTRDINHRNVDRMSAIDWARRLQLKQLEGVLIRYGAN